jgi:uncharacterized protein (AIM24 family)
VGQYGDREHRHKPIKETRLMHLPEPIPPMVQDASFAGVSYHIRGELVPELQIEVGQQSVMFEHHVLLWKECQLGVELRKLPGGIKRTIMGMEFLVTRTSGAGTVAFSRQGAGQCVPLHLQQGQEIDVRENHFLAATDNVDYSFERVQGVKNVLFGGSGFFIDKFRATNGDAAVWLHGHGNVFLVALDAGEQIDVATMAWLYKQPTVTMESVTMGLKTGMFGGSGKLTWNRFTGPGSIAIQTMHLPPTPQGENGQAHPGADAVATGGIAGLIGGVLGD